MGGRQLTATNSAAQLLVWLRSLALGLLLGIVLLDLLDLLLSSEVPAAGCCKALRNQDTTRAIIQRDDGPFAFSETSWNWTN